MRTIVKDLHLILTSTGMDDRAAALYLAGLQIGSGPASEYAKRVRINRITAYNALEELVSRGLFTKVRRQKAKYYAPVALEHLSMEVRKSSDALRRALPELRSLQGKGERRPRVRFFEGWDGVRHVYDDTLTAKTEILNFANSSTLRTFWPRYDEEYVAERVRRGIHLRGIAPDDAEGKRVRGQDRQNLREIRLGSSQEFDFTNEINIYDNTVAICSFGKGQDVFGVLIESKEVADTQRQIFEMAWRFAGRR